MVIAALGAAQEASIPVKFGVRNAKRPFADTVFPDVPGSSVPLKISSPFGPRDVTPEMGLGGAYFMLHGADWNGASFWGETDDSAMQEAWNAGNVPRSPDRSSSPDAASPV